MLTVEEAIERDELYVDGRDRAIEDARALSGRFTTCLTTY
jgi:hypothetical protein